MCPILIPLVRIGHFRVETQLKIIKINMSASAEIHPGEIEVLIEAMKSIGGGELTR